MAIALTVSLMLTGCSDDEGGLAKVERGPAERSESTSEVHTLEDGSTYQGQVQNGEKNGQGVYIWPNGDRYDGEWQAGLMSGQLRKFR